ncbi:hypothetical protein RRG08_059727 [Elysia crispata]|uniref:Uncharacterized protein n=1 Tax=Elysia crispata TaxID=231223 RepID=A0AAE0YND3_9GAST|nr:hypothetical protein RRG08_059727 [Elysia crispata]
MTSSATAETVLCLQPECRMVQGGCGSGVGRSVWWLRWDASWEFDVDALPWDGPGILHENNSLLLVGAQERPAQRPLPPSFSSSAFVTIVCVLCQHQLELCVGSNPHRSPGTRARSPVYHAASRVRQASSTWQHVLLETFAMNPACDKRLALGNTSCWRLSPPTQRATSV